MPKTWWATIRSSLIEIPAASPPPAAVYRCTFPPTGPGASGGNCCEEPPPARPALSPPDQPSPGATKDPGLVASRYDALIATGKAAHPLPPRTGKRGRPALEPAGSLLA